MGARGFAASVTNGLSKTPAGTTRLASSSVVGIGGGEGGALVRSSIHSEFETGATISAQATYIGERTIACYVAKDNYRSTKNIVMAAALSDPAFSEDKQQKFWNRWLQVR